MITTEPIEQVAEALGGLQAMTAALVDWLTRHDPQGRGTYALVARDGRPVLKQVEIPLYEGRPSDWVTRWSLWWREPSDDGLGHFLGKRAKERIWMITLIEREGGGTHLDVRRVYGGDVADWRIEVESLDVLAAEKPVQLSDFADALSRDDDPPLKRRLVEMLSYADERVREGGAEASYWQGRKDAFRLVLAEYLNEPEIAGLAQWSRHTGMRRAAAAGASVTEGGRGA